MDKKKLFRLRRENSKEFRKVSNLRSFLDNLLGEKMILPVIVGYAGHEKYWKVVNLHPLTNASELTVRNYLEGLRDLEQQNELFRGQIYNSPLDDLTRGSLRQFIFGVNVFQEGCSNFPYFSLRFNYDSDDRNIGYNASSGIYQTKLEQISSRFIGPNIDEDR